MRMHSKHTPNEVVICLPHICTIIKFDVLVTLSCNNLIMHWHQPSALHLILCDHAHAYINDDHEAREK